MTETVWTAVYHRYGGRYTEGFGTLGEAVALLRNGAEADDFSPAGILHPDGTAVPGDVLHNLIHEPSAVQDPELVKALAELPVPTVADSAWGSVWLHGNWQWLTKNMTTEEREHAANAVARYSAYLAQVDGETERPEPDGLRWWRDDT